MGYAFWTSAEERSLRRLYATTPNAELAERYGRPSKAIGLKARKMGLRKSCNAGFFKRGLVPWNKGKSHPATRLPQVRAHQFKPGTLNGAAARKERAVGTELVSDAGLLVRKVSRDGNRWKRWVPVHRLVWEENNGPTPEGHIVVFRPGMKTTNRELITTDRLECITRHENMIRNSRHTRYGPELNQLMQLRGALNRKIRNHETRKAT